MTKSRKTMPSFGRGPELTDVDHGPGRMRAQQDASREQAED
jgi:hypothetical protein